MSVTDKIKALLSLRGKKNIELAKHLGISAQSMQNKLSRGSFSAEDLIKIADFLDCSLEFNIDGKQKITLDIEDLRKNKQPYS
jgi:transcriptional regulator with XRE-family HTH domain